MPIFGPSQFEILTEKATNESNVSEDWQSILECCDYLSAQQSRPLDCLRSILKRMSNPHPNVSIQAIILLDACVSNCGKKFHLEVASREFLAEARKLLEKGHPKVLERFKLMIKKWSENEFKSDPELSMIPAFYAQLKKEGYDFTDPTKPQLPKDPNVVISDQEEEDIIKALELSMKDVKGSSSASGSARANASSVTTTTSNTSSSIYPDVNVSISNSDTSSRNLSQTRQQTDTRRNSYKKEPFKVRALYDFEAAEDNELTFKAGEVILVTDDSDENWWTGNNHRGEGLFPANFVTKDLNATIDESPSVVKSVQFDDQVRVKFLEEGITEVDEGKIDRLLHLIHEADPTGIAPDSDELIMLEDQCGHMGKLIDKELERLDRIQNKTRSDRLRSAIKQSAQGPAVKSRERPTRFADQECSLKSERCASHWPKLIVALKNLTGSPMESPTASSSRLRSHSYNPEYRRISADKTKWMGPFILALSSTVLITTHGLESSDTNGSNRVQQQQQQYQLFGNEDYTFARNGSMLQIDAGREWPFNSKREISFRFRTRSPHGLLIYQTFDHNKLQREEDPDGLELIPNTPSDSAQMGVKLPSEPQISVPIPKTSGQPISDEPLILSRSQLRTNKRRSAQLLDEAKMATATRTQSAEEHGNIRHLNRLDSDKSKDTDPAESLSKLSSSTITATASQKLVNSLLTSSHISAISGNSQYPVANFGSSQPMSREKTSLASVNGPTSQFGFSLRNKLLSGIVSSIDLEDGAGRSNYGARPKLESNDGSPVLSSAAINSLSASLYELYIKLENGRLKIVYEFGSRLNQTYCGKSLNDDRWHRVDLKVDPEINQMILTLDQVINVEIILSQAQHEEDIIRRNELVFTNSVLYLGGLNNNASMMKNVRQRLYQAQFTGCMGQIMLKTDQSTESSLQAAPIDKAAFIKRGCVNLCDTDNYCLHKSKCLNYYTHTKCDCFGTQFEDTYCWRDKLTTLTMLGYSTLAYRIYDWRGRHHSNVNRFSMQFKTLARESILFFAYGDLSAQQAVRNPINFSQNSPPNYMNLGYPTAQVNISSLPVVHRPQNYQAASNNNNYLAISLSNGSIVVEMNFGDQPVLLSNLLYDNYADQSLTTDADGDPAAGPPSLADNRWHNVTITHIGKQITLYLDDLFVSHTLTSKNNHLYFDPSIYVGGVPNFLLNETRALIKPINLRYKFVGCMRSVYFNQLNILLELKQDSQMVEYRDLLGQPLLDVCDVVKPSSLPITLRSGKSYLTFQLSATQQSSSALYSTKPETLAKPDTSERGSIKPVPQPDASSLVAKKLTWIEFEYRTSLQKHFLAGGHLRDLVYHDIGGFWTLQAREECQLYFTISSGLIFEPEQVLVLENKNRSCSPDNWYRVSISIMSGGKELNITRAAVDAGAPSNKTVDHGSYTLSSSVELLHQVQLGGDLAKFGEYSSMPFSGCIRHITINGHSFDSRDFVTTLTSTLSNVMPNTSQNATAIQLAQNAQYDFITNRMAQGYVTIDSCRLVNPCSTLNPCKNGGLCKVNELGEPDCDCSKTGYTGRRCHFSNYKRSCQDLYLSGQRKSSFYLIDLDRNGPLKPIRVRCNMEAGVNHIETSLAHNLPAEYLIRRSTTSDIYLDITYLAFHHMYTHDGFYMHDDNLEQARGFQEAMLRTLIGQSTSCKQSFRYECRSAPLGLGNKTWMEVPFPRRHKLMSLDGVNSGKCACASTAKRCLDPKRNCNCDSGEPSWSDDSYEFTSNEQVGISRIVLLKNHREELIGGRKELDQVESQSRISLSDLKCYGTSDYGNQHEITFKTSDAYIEVPGWRRGDISFNFRTASSPPAIILYQLATSRNHGYFRLTLVTDTRLLFEFVVNRRARKLFLTASHRLNNGEWQQVFIEYDSANLRLTVNDDSVLVDLDPNDHLGTFEGPMFIGGAPSKYLVGELSRRNGFTGCFKGLNINGKSIDLNDYLSSSMPTVISGCRPSCTKNLCQNGGKCIEYWGSYECECSNPIAHSGSNCEINLNTNSITFITQESHYVEQTSDSLAYPAYLIKSILLNIRTYQETALILYGFDQFNNFIQLHKNGSSLILTFNSNSTIVTARVPIEDESGSRTELAVPALATQVTVSLPSKDKAQIASASPVQSNATLVQKGNSTVINLIGAKLNQSISSTAPSGLVELDRSAIRVSNTSGSGQPIQVKIERSRLRTTFYVNNNFVVIEKPLILLTDYTQFPWLNPEMELVRSVRGKYMGPKSVGKIFLANVDEHFTTRLPGFTGCIQGFSIDNQLFDFNRAHLSGELRGEYKIGCKMHCDSFPCKNHGTCVENWLEDKIQCKCDATSYVGRLCDEDIAAIFNGVSSHLVYHLDQRLLADKLAKGSKKHSAAMLTPKDIGLNETYTGSASQINNSTDSPVQENSDKPKSSQSSVNFIEVSFAFSSDVNQSSVEQKSSLQVLVWISLANSSKYFFLGLTSDGGLLIQEDFGNSMSLSRLIKRPDQPFNDGYRHMIRYSRFNQTIQIMVDHQNYLPTMSVIPSNLMNRNSKTSIFVGTSDDIRSSILERGTQRANDDFVNYNGCISNLIIKIDCISIEPLSEAFGQNLDTASLNDSRQAQPIASDSLEMLPVKNNFDALKKDLAVVNGPYPNIAKYAEGQEDSGAMDASTKPVDMFARARTLLNMISEDNQDVLGKADNIVARNVEQGKCAAFKKHENLNEKRSINEPKYTQLLDPRPACMDAPRLKPYKRVETSAPARSVRQMIGPLFYCSLAVVSTVTSFVLIYAYILQVRYKSEKFRCQTPFFHSKRDERSESTSRTPTPPTDDVEQ